MVASQGRVFVRQQPGARAFVGWALLVKIGVLYKVLRRYFPDVRLDQGDRDQFGSICFFS